MDDSLQQDTILTYPMWYGKVSILVFMDDSLQRYIQISCRRTRSGFNPCFYGRFSATFCMHKYKRSRHKFQSLFLWTILCNRYTIRAERADGDVSILVFMDDSLQQSVMRYVAEDDTDVSILVFMDDSLQRLTKKRLSKPMTCFNPCFYGRFSATVRVVYCWHRLE